MDPKAANRINAAVDALFHRLPSTAPGLWYMTKHPSEPRIAFSVMHKQPGVGRKNYRGIPYHALRVIEQTSESLQEMTDRIYAYIVEERDTTQTSPIGAGTTVTAADVDKMVEARVQEALKKLLAQHAPAEKQGLQKGRYLKDEKKLSAMKAEVELWVNRAEQCGMPMPVYAKNGRDLDGRWLRQAKRLWEQFKATPDYKPETAAETPATA